MNFRLAGKFTLKSPLSHISESISINSYLVQEPILQDNDEIEEVFCYSGNAWRGQLRDLCAISMLENLDTKVSIENFHLLFSGGNIGSAIQVNIEEVKKWRKIIPMIALFGGGIGTQILPGKLRVCNSYPICIEANRILPKEYQSEVSYKSMIFEKEFTRIDDSKDDRKNMHLNNPDVKVKEQMRMSVELVIPGTVLYNEIDCMDVTDVELGCLVNALEIFSKSPFIGGQSNKGHGKVSLVYDYIDLDIKFEKKPFVNILTFENILLSNEAHVCKNKYIEHLEKNKKEIIGLLTK